MNDSPNFALGIAHFTLQIKCNHRRLAETLIKRYADFPPGKEIDFSAQVDWVGKTRYSSLLDTNTSFQNGLLRFSAPGYHGNIDEHVGVGQLQLSSAHPVEDIDYYLRVALALFAHKSGGILLHTAGIVRNGVAYLFFGHSGSGKTTVCQATKDQKSPAEEFKILNDDLILLLPDGKRFLAYSTPFWNPTQITPSNLSAPVAGIYLLTQDKQVYTQNIPAAIATASLISNVPVIPQDPIRSVQLLDTLERLIEYHPVYKLHFLPDNSFWDVIPA